jgi:uncharacterized damage-inducible protein DinB
MMNGGNAMRARQCEILLHLIDEAFDRKAWHGPNLRGSIRGLDEKAVSWRPAPSRHSIREVVLHAAYWKYAVRRRLTGEKRGSFPLTGSNWFPAPRRSWKEDVTLLESEHRKLRAVVASLSDSALERKPHGSKQTALRMIAGIAAHDIYHAGQIQLLKRLRAGG